jgi:hypothetical protein
MLLYPHQGFKRLRVAGLMESWIMILQIHLRQLLAHVSLYMLQAYGLQNMASKLGCGLHRAYANMT